MMDAEMIVIVAFLSMLEMAIIEKAMLEMDDGCLVIRWCLSWL